MIKISKAEAVSEIWGSNIKVGLDPSAHYVAWDDIFKPGSTVVAAVAPTKFFEWF